jgi:hypothetical protein
METRFPGGRPSGLGSLSIRKPQEQARRRKSCYEETSGDAAGFRAVVNKDIGKRTKHRGSSKPAGIIESQCGFINQQRL